MVVGSHQCTTKIIQYTICVVSFGERERKIHRDPAGMVVVAQLVRALAAQLKTLGLILSNCLVFTSYLSQKIKNF